MSKIYVQKTIPVLESTASLAISACVSGSALCAGYARLVGGLIANASSLAAASGFRILQSFNGGTSWDVISASDAIAACTVYSNSVEIRGNAVRVEFQNAGTAASLFRTGWWLRPI